MKKIVFILALLMPLILSAQPDIINLDELGSTWESIDLDTLYFSKDSTYITGAGDTIKFVVDDTAALWLVNTTGTGKIVVSPNAVGLETGIWFGDGNSGFYEAADDLIYCKIGGTNRFFFDATNFSATAGGNLGLVFGAAPSSTIPNVRPNRVDANTGIGHAGVDSLSLITGGVEGVRVAEGGGNIKVSITDTLTIGGAGILRLAEGSTPYALDSYGEIYTKSDNELYFQDGGGTEHVITLGASDYGEMGNVYGSSATEALPSANEWAAMFHANITGSAPHLNSGFSFVAGLEGSGTTTTAGTGDSINIADAAHGLAEGDVVTVQSANHVTTAYVTYIDASNFQIKVAYVADEAITWQMGSYLLVASTGIYRGAWNASFSQSLNNTQTSIVSPFVNITQSTKATAARLLANNTDVGAIGGNGIMSFTAGDRIWFAVQTTAAQTLTFTVRNISIQ